MVTWCTILIKPILSHLDLQVPSGGQIWDLALVTFTWRHATGSGHRTCALVPPPSRVSFFSSLSLCLNAFSSTLSVELELKCVCVCGLPVSSECSAVFSLSLPATALLSVDRNHPGVCFSWSVVLPHTLTLYKSSRCSLFLFLFMASV